MLLLPVVYLCVILAAIWAMGYHATHHAAILRVGRPRGMLIMLVVYLAPIVIGVTVIIFMFKPFFAHERQTGRTRSITRHSEPILFALVEKICELVGAPMPKRIDVDCEANASASLRRGMLSLFESDDLVLTIGMPLVMSLNTRQFVGVLAHEFGHFAQSSGMRLSYVVRLVSAWLASAVYRRDSWDEWLAAQADDESWLAWLFVCAQGGVWLTRRILWCLMMLGSLSASLLLQRMEFDADQYEAKVAGSDAFESTMRHMVELGAAYGDAVGALYHYFCEGRLADNLPVLVEYHRSRMQPEHREQLQKSVDESQSSWFRTHPAPSARISQALAAEAEGIFQLEIPASALFTDPAALCRNVTWDFYRARLGSKVMPSDLKPMTAELAAQT
jgi:Zn-dependent protease with chaperone function